MLDPRLDTAADGAVLARAAGGEHLEVFVEGGQIEWGGAAAGTAADGQPRGVEHVDDARLDGDAQLRHGSRAEAERDEHRHGNDRRPDAWRPPAHQIFSVSVLRIVAAAQALVGLVLELAAQQPAGIVRHPPQPLLQRVLLLVTAGEQLLAALLVVAALGSPSSLGWSSRSPSSGGLSSEGCRPRHRDPRWLSGAALSSGWSPPGCCWV
jgi:hypothetical protein